MQEVSRVDRIIDRACSALVIGGVAALAYKVLEVHGAIVWWVLG